MVYWAFMLLMVILIPAIMTISGKVLSEGGTIRNQMFGYRTSMSMKNDDTWEFANEMLGHMWIRMGPALLPVSVIPMLFVMGKGEDAIGIMTAVIVIIQCIPLVSTVVIIEKALHKNFDRNGRRKI
ncbi:MAG: SdpI family protein [Clostridiales bacterium]|nr:SdpI family protein [Clostridiales bacterium]